MTAPLERAAYSIPEVCQMLGVGETYLRDLMRKKYLVYTKIGRRILITRAAIDACLQRFQQGGARA